MEEFLAIVFGAVISAFIGLLGVYLTERLRGQGWKRENIYKPLYNEVSELITAKRYGLPEQLSTKWRTFDSYSKLMINKDLSGALSAHENRILEYNRLNEELTKASGKSLYALVEAVRRALKPLISEDNKSIVLERDNHSNALSFIDIKFWTNMFMGPLLTYKSGRTLYGGLVQYSKARKLGHEEFLRKWYAERPEILGDLVRECASVLISAELETIYRQLKRKRGEIIQRAIELRKKLEKKVK